jgi:hypothetical protein
MTVDVRIRRCTLTIRRRDGWGWGGAAQPYVDAALSSIEAALGAAMAEAGVPAGAEACLDEPVHLQFGSDGAVTAASWNALVERLQALPAALADVRGGPRSEDEAGVVARGDVDAVVDVDVAGEHAAGALARTLGRWSRGGRMAAVVSAWPETLVRAWIEAIAGAVRRPGAAGSDAPALSANAVELIAEGVLGAAARGPSGREPADRLLVLLGALTATLGDRLPDAATQALARRWVEGRVQDPARQQAGDGDGEIADADELTNGDDQPLAAYSSPQQPTAYDGLAADAGDTTQRRPTACDEPAAGADSTTNDRPIANADGTGRQPTGDQPLAGAEHMTEEQSTADADHTTKEQTTFGSNHTTEAQSTACDQPLTGSDSTTDQQTTAGDQPPASNQQTTAGDQPPASNQQTTAGDQPPASNDRATHRQITPDDQPLANTDQRTNPDGDALAGAPYVAAARPPSPPRARSTAAAGRPAPVLDQVVPALPLLVLAQLSRIGYVDAMVGAATAAGLPLGAGALGAAIAGKVLPAPRRGWRREPAENAAVAIASGEPAEHVAGALAEIAAHEQDLVAPLAAALQAAYAEGRSAKDELLVWTGEEGIVCGEEAGLLPAAWVASDTELDGALASLGRPPVRRDACFAPLARALHERPGLPRIDAPALERQLGAAAGTALGLIALDLWGSGAQPPTPLLALDRLADLEARVRSGPDGLLVAIPRGQRWLDLQRGGLLDLFTIPWLPAGRLEIGTW